MSRKYQPRDNHGRFSAKRNSEVDLHLAGATDAKSPASLSQQLSRTATLEPGAAATALKSPSSVVRASAKVIGWDLPAKIRQQFSRSERDVLQIVRPDMAA